MKFLYLGDPHVMSSNIEESEKLLQFVDESANKNQVDGIVILGDLFHTFGVLNTSVVYFWNKWLHKLSLNRKVYVLVGNHDKKNQSNDNDKENALNIFNLINSPNLFIVQSPVVFLPFAFVPYIHDKESFVKEANEVAMRGAKVLICHTDFDGAQYENGFYCPNGVKQEELNYDLIIGGHIHKRSRFGKVILPGTARWLNSSDKNEPKGLWIVEHDSKTGSILKEEFLDTHEVCSPIYSYEYEEGGNRPVIPEGYRVSINLIGSSEWIAKEKFFFKGKASISTRITDREKPKNRKTGHNFAHFVNSVFEPSQGFKREQLINFMKELGIL